MIKQFKNAILVGVCLLLVTGCTTIAATPTPQPAVPTAIVETVYVVVTATPEPATTTPEVSSTPTAMPVTDTPAPTNTAAATIVYPTQTPGAYNDKGTPVVNSSTSITILSIEENSSGKAVVKWTATGAFPNGFLVLYSQSIANPFYGGFPYYVVGAADRSAYVDVKPSTVYYYRVCSYTGSGCGVYSNSFEYTSPAATATP